MKKKITILTILSLTWFGLNAQFNYKTSGGSVIAGTYTDLGTNGSVIATANTDDANSAAIPIGFTFNYNGIAFTDFILNTNGFIKLGTAAPTSATIFGSASQTAAGGVLLAPTSAGLGNTNCISVLNHDLIGNAGAEYRVVTSGTAPNRICTIQYKDITEKTTTPVVQYASMNFQIRLFETSGIIEFVYGTFTISANPTNFKIAGVGLIGTDTASANTIFMRKGSTGAWNAAVFVLRPVVVAATNQSLAFRNTVNPTAGLTYRFTPTAANDLRVERIEVLGRSAIPFTSPEKVNVRISNVGINAIPAGTNLTVNVTGANPFTNTVSLPAIAAGTSVVVNGGTRSIINLGTDVITATIAADDNTANDVATFSQNVSNDDVSYRTSDPIVGGVGYNTGSGFLGCKYRINPGRLVKAVTVTLSTDAATTGKTIYGVAFDSVANVFRRSPNYVVQAADLGTTLTFNLDTACRVTSGVFYAMLAQTAVTPGYFPMGTQAESSPTRSGTYYGVTGIASTGPVVEYTTLGRFLVGAILDGADYQAQSVSTNAVCPSNNKNIDVTIKNNDFLALNLTTDSVKVTVNVTGPIAQTFTKTINTGTLAIGASQSFNITALADFSALGTYTINANLVSTRDANTANDNSSASVTMALPAVNAGLNQTICSGTTTTLIANGAVSYLWNNGAGSNDTVTVNPTTATTYLVTGTDANGCSNTDTVVVNVNSLPIVNLGSDISTCNASTILDAGNPGATYVWSNAATSQTITVTTNGQYYVTVTDANTCFASDTISVILNSGVATSAISPKTASICSGATASFVGGPSGGAYSVNAPSGVFTGTTAGTFDVVYTVITICGTATDTAKVTVNAAPTVTANASSSAVCIGGSATLTGGGAASYTWNNNVTNGVAFAPTSTLTYTVTGTDANTCSNTATVTVTVNALPVVTANASSSAVCSGNTLTLTGGGAVNYTWSNGVVNGVSFVPLSTTTYVVTGTDANTCSNTATQTVVVNPNPVASLTAPVSAPCAGTPITLTGLPAGGTYSVVSGNPSALTGNTFNAPSTGTYSIAYTSTNGFGCSDSAQFTFTVNCILGINNINGTNITLSVTPNPTNGMVNLKIENAAFNKAMIKVLGMNGQLLETLEYSGEQTVDLTKYASGVYYLSLSNDQFNKTVKIVKQ
jgi:Secretion system C-terminal sorting domain